MQDLIGIGMLALGMNWIIAIVLIIVIVVLLYIRKQQQG